MQAFGSGTANAPGLALTAGIKTILASGRRVEELAGLESLVFLFAADVTNRGIERNEGKVARIVTYEQIPRVKTRYVMIHVTAEGLITDFDTVDE